MISLINKYKKRIKRCDFDKAIKYFNVADFKGLNKEDISFKSNQGITLNGGIYYYNNYNKAKLVIFCHGMGPGHLAYMKEIEVLARQGYLVLAYDNTGTGFSEGNDFRAISQSLADLDACKKYVEANDKLKNLEQIIIGHSWGAYAAGNIANFNNKNIKTIVVISGFVSVKENLKQNLKGPLYLLSKGIIKYENMMNPNYALSSSLDAIKNNKQINYLIIHSKDDDQVLYKYSARYLINRIDQANVSFLITDKKYHNPNYTKDAVLYFRKRFSEYSLKIKNKEFQTEEERIKFMKSSDFNKMTAQDEYIWKEIFSKI